MRAECRRSSVDEKSSSNFVADEFRYAFFFSSRRWQIYYLLERSKTVLFVEKLKFERLKLQDQSDHVFVRPRL